MTDTTLDYFYNSAQSAPVGTEDAWSGVSNTNQASGYALTSHGVGDLPMNSPFLEFTNPRVAGQVPPSALISNIKIQIYADMNLAPPTDLVNCSIAGGTAKPVGSLVEDVASYYDVDGDLAFWGITNQQALDFVAGSEKMQFQTESQTDVYQQMRIYGVKAQFSYDGSSTVPPAVVF